MAVRFLVRRYSNNISNLRKSTGAKKVPFENDEVLAPEEVYISKIDDSSLQTTPSFSKELLDQLEQLSLVRIDSAQAVANQRKSVLIANKLKLVDVEGVKPMHTVWEDQECPVFDDVVESPLPVEEALMNAKVCYEEYYVTPPGNVPLESNAPLDMDRISQWDSRGSGGEPKVKPMQRTNSQSS